MKKFKITITNEDSNISQIFKVDYDIENLYENFIFRRIEIPNDSKLIKMFKKEMYEIFMKYYFKKENNKCHPSHGEDENKEPLDPLIM